MKSSGKRHTEQKRDEVNYTNSEKEAKVLTDGRKLSKFLKS